MLQIEVDRPCTTVKFSGKKKFRVKNFKQLNKGADNVS